MSSRIKYEDDLQPIIFPCQDKIVAKASGTQANGTPIVAQMNRIVTVASGGDAVVMPPSYPGLSITITNAHASNAVNIYPSKGGTGSEQINSVAANGAFSLGAGKSCDFNAFGYGNWHTVPLVP